MLTSAWAKNDSGTLKPEFPDNLDPTSWLPKELGVRASEGTVHSVAMDLLAALSPAQNDEPAWIHEALLKQEVWRVLIALRASGKTSPEASAGFEALIPALAHRMELDDGGKRTARTIHARLRRALADVRDWPLE